MLYERFLTALVVLVLLAGGVVGWVFLGKKPEEVAKPEPVSAPSQVRLDSFDVTTDEARRMQDATDEAIAIQNKSLQYDGFAAQNTSMASIENSVDRTPLFDDPMIGLGTDSGVMNFPGTSGFASDSVSRLELNRKLGNSLAAPESQNLRSLSNNKSVAHDYNNWLPKKSVAQDHDLSIETAKLVSFARFGEARVYQGDKLPTFKQLAEISVTTRDVSPRERSALAEIKQGKQVVVDDSESPSVVLSAIRATDQCSKCHQVSTGDLIGAFTFEFPAAEQP